MLLPQTRPFRKRTPRGRRPARLTLVAAELGSDPFGEYLLRLSFDRAVDAAGLIPSQVTFDDAAGAGWVYAATGVDARPDPQTLVLNMAATDVPAEGPTVLNATAATGLRAAGGAGAGGTWAGVTGVALPYP